jgi:peptidoglycan/xylan/chitin deacetylase (PgdA/CDA1 family)
MYQGSGSFLLKKVVKQIGSPALDTVGVFDRSIERLLRDASLWTILMYHRVIRDVRDDPYEMGMCVQLRHFEQQLAYLRRHFTVLPVQEVVQRLARGEPLRPGTVSITFDDGYLDNLQVAAPALERQGLPWSLYVTTGEIESGRPFWWDRVIRAVAVTDRRRLDLAELDGPEAFRAAVGAASCSLAPKHRRATLTRLLDALWCLPIEAAMVCVERLEAHLAAGVPAELGPQAPRLSPAQLRELVARGGVEIGAHTVEHPNLALQPAAQVLHEMNTSRRDLEALLDQPVPGFVYPGGRMSDAVIEQARGAGFLYALSTESRLNELPTDLMRLGRIGMPDSGPADFRRALHNQTRRLPRRPMSEPAAVQGSSARTGHPAQGASDGLIKGGVFG